MSVGGEITHELGIIKSAGAQMTESEIAALKRSFPYVRLMRDAAVEVAGKGGDGGGGNDDNQGGSANNQETYFPTLIGADQLHAQGIDGEGITVAVLDSVIWIDQGITEDNQSNDRVRASYDAIADKILRGTDINSDANGHGSHVTSLAASSRVTSEGKYNGIAPAADLVAVRAFDANGRSTYADVIRGIDWIVSKKDRYNIRVLNLSFSAEPRSHYWDDPLNQAVMAAWEAGIVVIASAGNTGPAAMTIGLPGNVPYIITVGAMTENYTPANGTDDLLTSFSAAGPTYEGFVKPEIVAPGGHMLGVMQSSAEIATTHPEFHDGGKYFTMSGTSQSQGS